MGLHCLVDKNHILEVIFSYDQDISKLLTPYLPVDYSI